MKQVQEEHLCRDIRRIALALEKIAKTLPSAKQEAPDINVGNMDAISRQATYLALVEKGQASKRYKIGETWELNGEEIREVLGALPSAQPEQRWIPCSERQPDKEGDYLVTLLDDGRTWVEIALWNETFGGRWQAVLYNDVDYSDISNVIAWMPLPEPYQGGEEG